MPFECSKAKRHKSPSCAKCPQNLTSTLSEGGGHALQTEKPNGDPETPPAALWRSGTPHLRINPVRVIMCLAGAMFAWSSSRAWYVKAEWLSRTIPSPPRPPLFPVHHAGTTVDKPITRFEGHLVRRGLFPISTLTARTGGTGTPSGRLKRCRDAARPGHPLQPTPPAPHEASGVATYEQQPGRRRQGRLRLLRVYALHQRALWRSIGSHQSHHVQYGSTTPPSTDERSAGGDHGGHTLKFSTLP